MQHFEGSSFVQTSYEWANSQKSILNNSNIETKINILRSCKFENEIENDFNRHTKEKFFDSMIKILKESNKKSSNQKKKPCGIFGSLIDSSNHNLPIKANHNILNSLNVLLKEKTQMKSRQIMKINKKKSNSNSRICYLNFNKKRICVDLLLDNYKEKVIREKNLSKNIFMKPNSSSDISKLH